MRGREVRLGEVSKESVRRERDLIEAELCFLRGLVGQDKSRF